MNRATILALIGGLALIGLADAGYLSYAALTHSALICDIAGLTDCNVVAGSPHSQLFGIPLAYYGFLFYALIVLCTALLFAKPSRLGAYALLAATALGAAASLYFMYVQIALIQAICIYCAISAAVAFALLLLAVLTFRRLLPAPPPVVS